MDPWPGGLDKEPLMTDRQSRPSFARRIAAARTREKKYCVWDEEISGLGVCVYPSGSHSR